MRFMKFGRRRNGYRSFDTSMQGTLGNSENNSDFIRGRTAEGTREFTQSERIAEETRERTSKRTPGCSGGDVMYDMGNAPYVLDIFAAAEANSDYRRVIWTGKHFQIVLMCVPIGGEIPFEVHEDNDQLFCVSSGQGEVYMGRVETNIDRKNEISGGYAAVIPSGTFHKVKNTGRAPLKLFTVYAPKHYRFGTRDINP